MTSRLIGVASALLLASLGCGAVVDASSEPETEGRLQDEIVGYSLAYPGGWRTGAGPVAATSFTPGAGCRNVEIVDYEPPPQSGSAAGVLHSFVQVCAKRLTDQLSLDDFMRATYGSALSSQFKPGDIAGVPAYRGRDESQPLIFLQTDVHRIQIYSQAVADADRQADRSAQVRKILESFSLLRKLSLSRARTAARQAVCKPGGRFQRCRTSHCTRSARGKVSCRVTYRYRSARASGSRRYRCQARVKVRFRGRHGNRLAVSQRIGTHCARV